MDRQMDVFLAGTLLVAIAIGFLVYLCHKCYVRARLTKGHVEMTETNVLQA